MTAVDELFAFLRAALDEDERVAREAASSHIWTSGRQWRSQHIARWDPARVLAEVEVKRRILDEFVSKVDEMDALIESEWGNGLGPIGESDALIKLLAQPYAGREGWREEWRLTSRS